MKLISLFITFSMLIASTFAFSSQEDVDKLLTMSETEKEAFIAERRALVAEEIKGLSKGLVCAMASADYYEEFVDAADRARDKSTHPTIKSLTNAEIAFYVDCGKNLSPFLKNINREYIRHDSDGLTNNTLSIIQSMGPFLLQKGTDGRTVTEYVRDMLRYANALNSQTLIGVYSSVLSSVSIVLREYEQNYFNAMSEEDKQALKTRCESDTEAQTSHACQIVHQFVK